MICPTNAGSRFKSLPKINPILLETQEHTVNRFSDYMCNFILCICLELQKVNTFLLIDSLPGFIFLHAFTWRISYMSAISLCNCTKSIQYATQGLFSVLIPTSEGARKQRKHGKEWQTHGTPSRNNQLKASGFLSLAQRPQSSTPCRISDTALGSWDGYCMTSTQKFCKLSVQHYCTIPWNTNTAIHSMTFRWH